MKKLFSIFIIAALISGIFVMPCYAEKLSIVTTIFPIYDWVREFSGSELENVDLTLLLDNDVDLHSYQPTVDDMIKISTCDVFIYVGGKSDEWVEDALKNRTNKNQVALNLLETLGDNVKSEEVIEGMEHEHEHEYEADEHVWLSLKNAKIICEKIAEFLSSITPEKKSCSAEIEASFETVMFLAQKMEELKDMLK